MRNLPQYSNYLRFPLLKALDPRRGVAAQPAIHPSIHHGYPEEEEKGPPHGKKWLGEVVHALNYL